MSPMRRNARADDSTSEQPEDFQAYLPIANLEVTVPDLEVGGAQLYQMDQDRRQDIAAAIGGCMDRNLGPPEGHAEMHALIDTVILPPFDNCACLQFALTCAPRAVQALAAERANEVISLLRLFAVASYPPEARARVGVSGTVLRAETVAVVVSKQGAQADWALTGARFQCTIDADKLTKAREDFRFDELSAVVAKTSETRTQYERLLVTALHWFGEATQEDSPPHKVVLLCTALETLLISGHCDRITNELAERVAIVMHAELDARKQAKRRMKKLYGLRSRVVHNGKRNVADKDARKLECIVPQIIVRMAGRLHEIQEKTDLEGWFDDIRRGSGSTSS